MIRALTLFVVFFSWATTALSQGEADKDFLTRQLQDLLSDSGRAVVIDGFRGALTSEASFDRMTIADEDGVWLTLEDVALIWSRAALLRGRLEVDRLTAARINMPRLPVPLEEDLPSPEASAPLRLPDLPVSVNLANFKVDEVTLGAPVVGQPLMLELQAAAALDDVNANLSFLARRIDGKDGQFVIQADYDRSETLLDLTMAFTEEAGGVVASNLNVPGAPSVIMTVKGKGPIDDFTADLTLATDGVQRIAGQVSTQTQAPRRTNDTPDRRIVADIGGDITTVLLPAYRDFFGDQVSLQLDALIESSGAIEISDFKLNAAVANLAGKLNLNAENWPTFVDIKGRLKRDDGAKVVLPFADGSVSADQMGLRVLYDAAAGESYTAGFNILGFETRSVSIARAKLSSEGTLQGNLGSVGQLLGQVSFDASGLQLDNRANAEAVGDQVTGNVTLNYIEGQPLRLSDLDLTGADYGLTGMAVINGLAEGFATRFDMALSARDISRFSALAGQEIAGQTGLSLKGRVVPTTGAFDIKANGQSQDIVIGVAQADALLAGQTDVSFQALRDETGTRVHDLTLVNQALSLTGQVDLAEGRSRVAVEGRLTDIALVVPQYEGAVALDLEAVQDGEVWRLDSTSQGPYGVALTLDGPVTGPDPKLSFTARVPQTQVFAAQLPGVTRAKGTLQPGPEGWRIEAAADAPKGISLAAEGLVTPALDLEIDAKVANLNPFVASLSGPATAQGRVRQTRRGIVVDTDLTGPGGLQASVEGIATGPDMSLTFDASVARIQRFAPGVAGQATARGVLRRSGENIALEANATGPYATQARVEGIVAGQAPALDFTASMANLGALVPKVSGRLGVTGTARQQPDGWAIETQAIGPGGTQARIGGMVLNSGTLDLAINGTAPLGLSRPFIAPRNLQGQARFDLTMRGPAGLNALSGRISTTGATLSAPNLRIALRDISAEVGLSDGRADVQLAGNAINGGRASLRGGVALAGALQANLDATLQGVELVDPRLYRTSVDGQINISGPLAGGAQIGGELRLGETLVTVPSTGLTSIGDIPAITHIGESAAVNATRRKAGLLDQPADPRKAAAGPAYGLDISIRAPSRIFVRGRGLDAELGGRLRLIGTTARVISSGQFSLLRGRFDILGKRFDLVQGLIQFQGDFIPFIRFVSETPTQTGTVRVIVQGPANAPEVLFESSPTAPQDEVLAQLLFGRNINDISAFQALQLANAVAVLAGRGGSGLVSDLRDRFGLDDLDVTTTDEGATALSFGKYISENVYTDVTAASDGTGEVSLNIDLSRNLKAKGTLGSDGNSSLGIFFEKDY